MTEPITAVTIAALAFNEFIKAGAGELAKESVKKLRDYLKSKFVGNDQATNAIAEIEQQGTEAALTKFTKYLDLEMVEDEVFANDVRQLARQIINNQTVENRQYNNYGRDQINIENITGNPRIGGS